jgi:hypothetical protein
MAGIRNRIAPREILVSFAVLLAAQGQSILGDDAPAKQALPKKTTTLRGRLPAHYGKVVTEQQRNLIYKIQAEYRPKVDLLEAQLTLLKRERDTKIEAVLTPAQKKLIEEATRAKAKKPLANVPDDKPKDPPQK